MRKIITAIIETIAETVALIRDRGIRDQFGRIDIHEAAAYFFQSAIEK